MHLVLNTRLGQETQETLDLSQVDCEAACRHWYESTFTYLMLLLPSAPRNFALEASDGVVVVDQDFKEAYKTGVFVHLKLADFGFQGTELAEQAFAEFSHIVYLSQALVACKADRDKCTALVKMLYPLIETFLSETRFWGASDLMPYRALPLAVLNSISQMLTLFTDEEHTALERLVIARRKDLIPLDNTLYLISQANLYLSFLSELLERLQLGREITLKLDTLEGMLTADKSLLVRCCHADIAISDKGLTEVEDRYLKGLMDFLRHFAHFEVLTSKSSQVSVVELPESMRDTDMAACLFAQECQARLTVLDPNPPQTLESSYQVVQACIVQLQRFWATTWAVDIETSSAHIQALKVILERRSKTPTEPAQPPGLLWQLGATIAGNIGALVDMLPAPQVGHQSSASTVKLKRE